MSEYDVEQIPDGIHPPGTIALPCGELGRYSAHAYCLACLQYPPGTRIAMSKGISIPRNLNTIIREMTGEWVWLMGDDHVFDPHLLVRLLDRDLDVVVPICIRRHAPFAPVLFVGEEEAGHKPVAYDEIPHTGVFPVYAAGTAGMLVRRHVLDAIGDPWFHNSVGEHATEDLEFCRSIREAGYTIHADSNNLLGHIGLTTIWPKLHDGHWGFLFDFGEGPEGAMNQVFINAGAREADTANA